MLCKIKKFDPNAIIPAVPQRGNLGIDLFHCISGTGAAPLTIEPGKMGTLHTGIGIQFPKGFGGIIRPRGKDKFLVGSGVIDYGYQGEILVRVFNCSDQIMYFGSGASLGQLVLVPCYNLAFETVNEFDADYADRGSLGGIWNRTSQDNLTTGKIDFQPMLIGENHED